MKMKRSIGIILALMLIMGCGSIAPYDGNSSGGTAAESSVGMDMDAAIKEAATQMEAKIPSKTMVALVSVASPSTAFSTQVLTRLESAIVSSGKLVVVDRANLDKVREEQGFQLSGEVDDESAKSIGKLLGAGAIVTGSLADLGDVYSLTLKAINIETATVAVSYLADIAKSTRVEVLLTNGGGVETRTRPIAQGGSGSTAPANQIPAPAAPPAPYKIGDKGPAGGIVFYDKGNDSDGWRFLEAASEDVGMAKWGGLYNEIGGTKVEVGTGKRNTDIIGRFMRGRGETGTPAQLCQDYSQGEFDDWFLPSKDELNLMYRNLEQKGIVTFPGAYYWTSSEVGMHNVWVQRFSDGTQDGRSSNSFQNNEKHSSHSVRPIRRF